MPRQLFLAFLAAALLAAQKYNGPRPPKPDVIYLLHATNLVETELAEAKEEKRKDDTAYVVDGAASPAKTPLAEPIFLIESKRIIPDKLQLYKLDTKSGRREVVFPPHNKRRKDGPRPLHLSVKRLADGIYRLEANEFLQNGEYALTPEGSNQVFLFQVY
jgi:hypothetical protein